MVADVTVFPVPGGPYQINLKVLCTHTHIHTQGSKVKKLQKYVPASKQPRSPAQWYDRLLQTYLKM